MIKVPNSSQDGRVAGCFKCSACCRQYEGKWEAKRHEKRCRPSSSNRVCVKKDGAYPCEICEKRLTTLEQFKLHIWEAHSEVEVRGRYNRGLEDVIGHKFILRYRHKLFRSIE